MTRASFSTLNLVALALLPTSVVCLTAFANPLPLPAPLPAPCSALGLRRPMVMGREVVRMKQQKPPPQQQEGSGGEKTWSGILRRIAIPPFALGASGLALHSFTGASLTHGSTSLGMAVVEELSFLIVGIFAGIMSAFRKQHRASPLRMPHVKFTSQTGGDVGERSVQPAHGGDCFATSGERSFLRLGHAAWRETTGFPAVQRIILALPAHVNSGQRNRRSRAHAVQVHADLIHEFLPQSLL